MFLFLLMLAAAAPSASAQSPYFTLSTTRSFAPDEKPRLHLYTRNESELEFRIYRVHDEEKFISGLSEMHSFGEMQNFAPVERIDEETLLERFHDWKQSIWSRIKQFSRTQLSRQTRDALKLKQSSLAQRSRIVGVAQFAQIPLLNDSQLVARWRQQVPPTYIADDQVLPIDPLPGGMYLVEATDGHLKAYTLLFVSQAALVTRTTAGQLLAYVVDRKTGVPISGAQVVLSLTKQPTARQITAEDGVAAFDAPAKQAANQFEDASDRNLWVMARVGKDVALVAPWYSSFLQQAGDRYVGYTYTDRPVYRPGHTVHFRSVIRERAGDTLTLPKLSTVHVTVTDDQQKNLYDKQLPVSPMGTVQGDMVLPDDASLGDYSITVGEGAETGTVGRGFFQVQEYRKPEYQIRVSSARPRILQGDSNQVTVEARYFFGEPVANAKVKIRVYQNTHYWWGEDEDSDSSSAEESSNDIYTGDETNEQEGRLDANGKLTVSVPTSFDEDRRYDRDYVIEAAVTDEAGREITGRYRFLATYGSFHVRVESLSYVVVRGQQASFRITAMDYDGKPVQTTVHLHLSQYNYRDEKKETPAGDADVTTGADGTAMVRLPVNVSGSIRVLAQATTPEKRQVQDKDWLWVSSSEETWSWGESEQARIIADKKTYAPGDTAHLTLASEVSGVHALVTATGNAVLFRKTLSSDGRSVSFDLPVTSDSQPNVIVDAVFVKDGKVYQARKTLKVPPVQQQLQITVTPAANVFQPGQSAVYDVTARDAQGRPVVAELSFGVVDEALYSIYP
ncbi:MAG: MG2 domain-containing protein, partial [Acidobacteriaceae bacterium]|nr:MG2 domain-containing protein [Acidobacteriaceae bacterium]